MTGITQEIANKKEERDFRNRKKSIIALCGPATCGKSTLAELLIEHHGYIRLSFAAPIKEMLRAVLRCQGAPPYTINQMLFGSLKEEPSVYLSNQTPRRAMQTLGTEWRDLMDKNFWTNIWLRSTEFVSKIIVDDMRFLHESDAIRNVDGKIILIERPGVGPGTHPSEQDYLQIEPDFKIINDQEPMNMLLQLYALGIA